MNDLEIVSNLLEFYKSQGMDLHYLLDDQTFHSLPLQSKVDAIKRHALDIAHGTSSGFGKLERKALITRAITMAVQGAIAGGAAGASIGAFNRGVPRHVPFVLGAVSGAAAGIGKSVLDSRQEVSRKAAVRNQLLETSKNPTDANALGSLSVSNIHAISSRHRDDAYHALREQAAKAISPDRLVSSLEQHIARIQATQPK